MAFCTVWNAEKCIHTSKNLRAMLRGAKDFGGVKRLELTELPEGKGWVNCVYNNGFEACTDFSSFGHLKDWATAKRNRKGTHFSGCEVQVHSNVWTA